MGKIKNYRGLTRVNMIEVREGEGTTMDPVRIVRYFTDDKGVLLGRENHVTEEDLDPLMHVTRNSDVID